MKDWSEIGRNDGCALFGVPLYILHTVYMYLNVGLESSGEAVPGLEVAVSVEVESSLKEVVERGRR